MTGKRSASLLILIYICSCLILAPDHTCHIFSAAAHVSSPVSPATLGNRSSGHRVKHGDADADIKRGAAYIATIDALLNRNHTFSSNDEAVLKQAGATQRLRFLNSSSSRAVLVHVHIQKASGTALAATMSTSCQCHKVKLVSPLRIHYTADHCRYCPKVIGHQSTSTMTSK